VRAMEAMERTIEDLLPDVWASGDVQAVGDLSDVVLAAPAGDRGRDERAHVSACQSGRFKYPALSRRYHRSWTAVRSPDPRSARASGRLRDRASEAVRPPRRRAPSSPSRSNTPGSTQRTILPERATGSR